MRKSLTTLMLAWFVLAGMAQTQAPAFPGAEGFARYTTTGGRGGKVIHVTNLNDSGSGSLRAALNERGARTVVFDVSGIIELSSTLKINNGDVSILGQTAPGDGICLKNYGLRVNASNVIIRFILCRMGDEAQSEDDAMNGYFHSGQEKENVIIDHCSISWSTDECASFYGIRNFTLQWCVLSESLRNSVHGKGKHGYGGIWGGDNAAYHHNLLAHHDSRNPRFDHDYVSDLKGPVDYVNNVIYNWGGNSSYGGESSNSDNRFKMYNLINNYYKAGPASSHKNRIINPTTKCSNCTKTSGLDIIVPGHFYLSGNYVDGYPEVTADNWKGVEPDENTEAMKAAIKSDTRFVGEDYEGNYITTHDAQTAFERVTTLAGASLHRDAVDQRIARETIEGSYTYTGSNGSANGLIDSQADVGGWPTYTQAQAATDTSGDGIPDEWARANGLNPEQDNANGYDLDPQHLYTNLEVYANSLVETIVRSQTAGADVSLTEYYPATSIHTISENSSNRTEYYSLKGERLTKPQKGVNIRVERHSDGRIANSQTITQRN